MDNVNLYFSDQEVSFLSERGIEVPEAIRQSSLQKTQDKISKLQDRIQYHATMQESVKLEKSLYQKVDKKALIWFAAFTVVAVAIAYFLAPFFAAAIAMAALTYIIIGGFYGFETEKIHRSEIEFEKQLGVDHSEQTLAPSRKFYILMGALFGPLLFLLTAFTIDRNFEQLDQVLKETVKKEKAELQRLQVKSKEEKDQFLPFLAFSTRNRAKLDTALTGVIFKQEVKAQILKKLGDIQTYARQHPSCYKDLFSSTTV